jgi:hypothetical protein
MARSNASGIVQSAARLACLANGLPTERANLIAKSARNIYRERFAASGNARFIGAEFDRLTSERDAAISLYAEAAGIGLDTAQQMVKGELEEQSDVA